MNETLTAWLPGASTLVIVTFLLYATNWVVRRNQPRELSVPRQFLMIVLTLAGLVLVIFTLPLEVDTREQVLGLLGIMTTAVIALSSTTFVANIMAGLMLRAVNAFQPGDFVRCQELFGRVTERGIFHTEIQTEDRDIATLPNLYLVNNPVTVILESGTVISTYLSLGYDVHHALVEPILRDAAEHAGLNDAFVLVSELNDFSVTYRVGGFSADVKNVLSAKSTLHKQILSALHDNNIEIVSPNFMNQRVLAPESRVIPVPVSTARPAESNPESVIFDKAEQAAEREQLQRQLHELVSELAESDDKEMLEAAQISLRQRIADIESELARLEEAGEES